MFSEKIGARTFVPARSRNGFSSKFEFARTRFDSFGLEVFSVSSLVARLVKSRQTIDRPPRTVDENAIRREGKKRRRASSTKLAANCSPKKGNDHKQEVFYYFTL